MRAAGDGGRPPTSDSQCLARGGQPAESAGPEKEAKASRPLARPLEDGEQSHGALKERLPTNLHSHERKGETLSLCLEPQERDGEERGLGAQTRQLMLKMALQLAAHSPPEVHLVRNTGSWITPPPPDPRSQKLHFNRKFR